MIGTIRILESGAFFSVTQAVPRSVAVTCGVGCVFDLHAATAVK